MLIPLRPTHSDAKTKRGINLSVLKTIENWSVQQCLVAVRYRKLPGAPWRRVGRRPEIETYLSDVSEKYREPQIEHASASRVVIRVFDALAVDLTRQVDRLGDYSHAVTRCDDCLRKQIGVHDEAEFTECLEPWY